MGPNQPVYTLKERPRNEWEVDFWGQLSLNDYWGIGFKKLGLFLTKMCMSLEIQLEKKRNKSQGSVYGRWIHIKKFAIEKIFPTSLLQMIRKKRKHEGWNTLPASQPAHPSTPCLNKTIKPIHKSLHFSQELPCSQSSSQGQESINL